MSLVVEHENEMCNSKNTRWKRGSVGATERGEEVKENSKWIKHESVNADPGSRFLRARHVLAITVSDFVVVTYQCCFMVAVLSLLK